MVRFNDKKQPVTSENHPRVSHRRSTSVGWCRLASSVMKDRRPLPFRIRVPGYDSIDTGGIISISIKLEGLLHVEEETISLEWSATRTVEAVSMDGIKDEVDQSPLGSCEVPMSHLLEARIRGGWWSPRLELRAGRLGSFEEIPTAQNGILKLRIRRCDRDFAKSICGVIGDAQNLTAGDNSDVPRLKE